jgi:multiple sugar transport system substrate-binding protein
MEVDRMRRLWILSVLFLVVLGLGSAGAQVRYDGITVNVIAQRTPEWAVIDAGLPAFQKQTGMKVDIKYLEETERRSKSRIDSATNAGSYSVYYVDEANIAEFATAGWLVPLEKYYPAKYDFKDFPAWIRGIGTIDGIAYFAPVFGGGDVLFYRKDILANKGIKVPKTMDELIAAAKALNDPPNFYGITTRGLRGSGSNCWRWAPLFIGLGGQWFDSADKPAFNSAAAVKATKYALDMFKYAPPGATTSTFADDVEAFRSGKLAFLLDTYIFYNWMEDPTKSNVVGKVGYAAPPSPVPSSAFGHGLAISAVGAKTEKQKQAAGEFIGWATSKEIEMKKLAQKMNVYRQSSLDSPLMTKFFAPEIITAMNEAGKVTKVCFMRRPEWPEIGDNLGIVLEQIYTGQKSDIQAALDEAVDFANGVLNK